MIDTRSNHLISNGTPQRLGLQVALSFQFLGRIDGQHPPILQHHDPDNTANAVTRDQNRREPTRDPTGICGVFSLAHETTPSRLSNRSLSMMVAIRCAIVMMVQLVNSVRIVSCFERKNGFREVTTDKEIFV